MQLISPSTRLAVPISHDANPQARTLTRRTLLRDGAAATAAAMLGASAWSIAPAAASAGHLRRSSYTGLVGESFRAGSVELRLLSVTDVAGAKSARSLAGSENAFVLTFAAPRSAPLAGGTHSFRQRRLGKFELFVSPVGRPRKDRRYEAVVDRSVAAPR